MAWKNIDPKAWGFDNTGDSVQGVYVGTEKPDNYSQKYYLQHSDEGLIFVWGCKVLDDKMRYVENGTLVKITYTGKVKNEKGREYNTYDVELWEADEDGKNDL